jgi:hypothetical protein
MVMDCLRRGSMSITTVRPYSDRPDTITVRWYQARKDALPFPQPHAFGSTVWDSGTEDDPKPVGEQFGNRQWVRSKTLNVPGNHFHGLLEWFQNGVPYQTALDIWRALPAAPFYICGTPAWPGDLLLGPQPFMGVGLGPSVGLGVALVVTGGPALGVVARLGVGYPLYAGAGPRLSEGDAVRLGLAGLVREGLRGTLGVGAGLGRVAGASLGVGALSVGCASARASVGALAGVGGASGLGLASYSSFSTWPGGDNLGIASREGERMAGATGLASTTGGVGSPTGISVGSATSSTLKITFTLPVGSTAANVYRSTSPSGPWTLVGSTVTSPYTVTGLLSSHTYYFLVSALDLSGFPSPTIGIYSGTTLAPGPGISSSNIAITNAGTSLITTWSTATNAGDLLLCVINSDSSLGTISHPAGYTLISSEVPGGSFLYVFAQTNAAAHSAGDTESFSWSGANAYVVCANVAISGFSTATFDRSSGQGGAGVTPIATPSVVTVASQNLAISAFGTKGATASFTVTSGYYPIADQGNNPNGPAEVAVCVGWSYPYPALSNVQDKKTPNTVPGAYDSLMNLFSY